jgi:hypothetical protein
MYVRLLDEGTAVSRPVKAVALEAGCFQLLPTPDYDPDEEHWEFPPGSMVRWEWRGGADGDLFLAVNP